MNAVNEINNWLSNNRDYHTGIALLQRYGKNKVLAATLSKPGKEKFEQNRKKLVYELQKITGSHARIVAAVVLPAKPVKKPNPVLPQAPVQLIPLINHKPITEYPETIRRIKHEYSELYNRRSIKHKAMGDVPTENSPANMDARAKLLGEIKLITSRMEELYRHLEAYEKTGVIPDAAILWPKPPEPEQLPDDADKLRLMKKNLQTSNTKDRNLLEYQQQKKADTPANMPDGPKRKMIEGRIKAREKMIEKIDWKLREQLEIKN
jgi:hypothetical protein